MEVYPIYRKALLGKLFSRLRLNGLARYGVRGQVMRIFTCVAIAGACCFFSQASALARLLGVPGEYVLVLGDTFYFPSMSRRALALTATIQLLGTAALHVQCWAIVSFWLYQCISGYL